MFFWVQIWPSVLLLLPHVQLELQRSSSVLRLFVRSFLCSLSSNRSSCFRSVVLQVPKLILKDSVFLFRTRVYKTRDLSGIIFSNSPSGNQVFNPRVLDWNWVYKTRDASLQFSSNHVLTYDIISSHFASLQIPSLFSYFSYSCLSALSPRNSYYCNHYYFVNLLKN